MTVAEQLLTPRYRLRDHLGAGTMGMVVRAYDRLTGTEVALKQVRLSPDLDPAETDQELLALTQEFRILAGLRHPHIISVLDYGLTTDLQPFYTMELLSGARSILADGHDLPIAARVERLLQALEALAYLHRRGVLHHDLKPANMLVAEGRLRLLDFGLAVSAAQARADDTFGTLQYLAPEVLDGQPYGETADLYSIGVIAYELFVGRHPFSAENLPDFLDQVLDQPPDLTPLAAEPALAAIIGRLLAKTPAERPTSAQETIDLLRATVTLPHRSDTPAIRESYLQAATFVGRDAELAMLTDALPQARAGRGSAWLVGGESGVGKSRLLDELRIQALVAGFTVLRGQAVERGGLPYQLWREPLCALALGVELSDLEAGVLKTLVPEIATLLERAVPEVPPLIGAENQQRLVRVIIKVLERFDQPLLLLLEDLHWANESIVLLHEVTRLRAQAALMIVGTYRNDDRPALPEELPAMRPLLLERLTAGQIAQLSAAMLGEGGQQQAIVAFLERETEGNIYFMVEVVRSLAEEVGSLAAISHTTLPAQVVAGGVQQLVQRKLGKLPPDDRPLLQLAAVLGRQIDLTALAMVAAQETVSRWLFTCGEFQVLEAQGEGWRFTHDKLREGVLSALPGPQHQALHRQATQAIELAYAADLAPQAARLTEHYRQAGAVDRERHYARLAGDYAAAAYAHADAARFYSQALALIDDEGERYALLLAREEVLGWQGAREAQAADLAALAALADQLGDDRRRVEAIQRHVSYSSAIGQLVTAATNAESAVRLAQAIGDIAVEADTRLLWGIALFRGASYAAAQAQLQEALALARRVDRQTLIIDCLSYLGATAVFEGDQESAQSLFQSALEQSRALADRRREGHILNGIALACGAAGDSAAEAAYLEAALQLNRQIGRVDLECLTLINLGIFDHFCGNFDQAEARYQASLQLARLIRDMVRVCNGLYYLGMLAQDLGDRPRARQLLTEALQQASDNAFTYVQCYALVRLSYLELDDNQPEAAKQHALLARDIAQQNDLIAGMWDAAAALGSIHLHQSDVANAERSFQDGVVALGEHLASLEAISTRVGLARLRLMQHRPAAALHEVEQMLSWLQPGLWIELYDLIGVYLTCYQVLSSQHDPRAAEVLENGCQELQRRAASIGDPVRRRVFLEQVPSNAALLAACEGRAAGTA